jgi:hypothetical protein
MIRLPDDDPAEHCSGFVNEPLRQTQVAERDRRVHVVDEERPEASPVRGDSPRDSHLERSRQTLDGAVMRIQRNQPPDTLQGSRRIARSQRALDGDPERRLVLRLTSKKLLDLRARPLDVPDLEECLGEHEPGSAIPRVTCQPLAAERHRLTGSTGPAVRLRQCRVGLGGGLPGQPRLELSDLVGGRHAMSRPGPSRPSLYGPGSELVNVGEAQTCVAPRVPAMTRIVGPHDSPRYSGAMLGAWQRLVAIGTGVALAGALTGEAPGAPAIAPNGPRAKAPRTYLIHLIDGGDPIVVQKYTEQGGEIRFEKYGGWVSIPSYEVLRIVPDDSDDAVADILPAPTAPGAPDAPLYVATRSGATVRASSVDTAGSDVRVSTPEGSLTFHRTDLVGVLRVPAAPAPPEAWITLWGAEDGSSGGSSQPAAEPDPRQPAPTPALSGRPHLLQLANGVVIQVDGFWIEAGEIRFRRLGGVVGFALGEIAKLLPQEVEPAQGRLAARFVRRLGPDRLEVRVGRDLQRIHLIGIEPIPGAGVVEDPWETLDQGLLVHLEFDRKRYEPDGQWLAYLYLPNGRMLNAELIRVGLARPRSEPQNLRYVDLFQEIAARPR